MLSEGESGTRLTLVSIAEIEAGEGINPIYDESPYTLDPYYQPHTFHTNLTLANSQREYYIYDHLGNTRITYTPFLDNLSLTSYWLRNVYDYYPYGKILRTFSDGTSEKYLTTQHERDAETGLDYRFARFYDSDLGRFLGVDPKSSKFPDLSPYNYVFDNPIKFIDPNGEEGEDPIKKNINAQQKQAEATTNLAMAGISFGTLNPVGVALGATFTIVAIKAFKDAKDMETPSFSAGSLSNPNEKNLTNNYEPSNGFNPDPLIGGIGVAIISTAILVKDLIETITPGDGDTDKDIKTIQLEKDKQQLIPSEHQNPPTKEKVQNFIEEMEKVNK
ncbi:MAG TPA: RHS repeat-associated core domain-containing protein [Saprospiraceae bacterium]|nr:RHS repeat-associated core domain-containing protein [Saprospiraceae bacterium]